MRSDPTSWRGSSCAALEVGVLELSDAVAAEVEDPCVEVACVDSRSRMRVRHLPLETLIDANLAVNETSTVVSW